MGMCGTLFLTYANPSLVSTKGSKRSASLPPRLARVVGESRPWKLNVSVPFSPFFVLEAHSPCPSPTNPSKSLGFQKSLLLLTQSWVSRSS